MLRWYAARTRPLTEYAAKDRLEAEGVETFLPCMSTTTPRRGRSDEPLFPSYLFLRLDLEDDGTSVVRRIPAVMGLVRFDGAAAPVDEQVIDELVERVESIEASGGHWQRFEEGDTVWLRSGAIQSLAQVVTGATSPDGRVRVLLDFLGRKVYADAPWCRVELARGDAARAFRSGRPRRTRGKGRWIQGYRPQEVASR